METQSKHPTGTRHPEGFALIAVIMLMALLLVIGLGLLSLSSVVIRTSGHGNEQAAARANARMALMMAIGQLQEAAGDDRRITMVADQRGDDEGNPVAAANRKHWTGVYNSWQAGDPLAARPAPSFRQWLVSGEESILQNAAAVQTAGGGGTEIEMVGEGSLGSGTDGGVFVPAVDLAGGSGRLAWWTGDQGVKAMVTLPPAEDAGRPELRAQVQASARNGVSMARTSGCLPFSQQSLDEVKVTALTDWPQAAHLGNDPETPKALFHDLAMYSSGLLTNVSAGGFRKDLSMELERASHASAPTTPLYQLEGRMVSESYLDDGINLEELWAFYNLYKELRPASGNFTTGGSFSGIPAFRMESTTTGVRSDPFQHFKTPFIIHYQMIFSFFTRDVAEGKKKLFLSVDPIVTLWNPLDVPILVPPNPIGLNVKFGNYPYDLIIRPVNPSGGPAEYRCPLVSTFQRHTLSSGDVQGVDLLNLTIGRGSFLVNLRPGEVVQYSQADVTKVTSSRQGFGPTVIGRIGFNFGGGVHDEVRDENGNPIVLDNTGRFTVEVRPNGITSGKKHGSGGSLSGADNNTQHFGLNFTEYDIGLADGADSTGIGGVSLDWYYGNAKLRRGEFRTHSKTEPRGTKPPADRLYANQHPNFFPTLPPSGEMPATLPETDKRPFMMLSTVAKTEDPADSRTKWLQRLNPRAFHTDFYDLSREERSRLPFEYRVQPMDGWISDILVSSANGQAYFGGGIGAGNGVPIVATHSVPREPIISLGALQHSFANGFERQKILVDPLQAGHMIENSRFPMQPQISHAISNSHAPSVLPMDQTHGMIPSSGLPLADHSYLANKGLWDDWFFSSIAPQTAAGFTTKRTQKEVAQDFFGKGLPLPNSRYKPNLENSDAAAFVNTLIPDAEPVPSATAKIAPRIRVDGLFNVNSTSVQAWKALLAGLNGVDITTRNTDGQISVSPTAGVPVAALLSPTNAVVDASGQLARNEPNQYAGRRELGETELESLAQEIVKEVRKRGPFLSLADFVNRRVGTDVDLARAGALQCAIENSGINAAFEQSGRSHQSSAAVSFAFPEAEVGPLSQGIATVIDQADMLTPIAPVLSARSDSFIIRAYGDARDSGGNILARAWCEAVVERDSSFVDGGDEDEALPDNLTSSVNRTYGRKFNVRSFRWLEPNEI
jgi:hypothetical protein